MSDPVTGAVEMLEGQIKGLQGVLQQAGTDLNTVAGKERVTKWKAQTFSLIAQHLGPQHAQRFADTQPGPCFTNDLLEELTDEADVYISCLTAMAKELKQKGQ